MPELPEVETVCRGLRQVAKGHVIGQVSLFRPDLRIPFPPHFAQLLKGRKITNIERRAKYIKLMLDDGAIVLVHLGMSGKLVVYDHHRAKREKHDHVVFTLDSGKEIVFNDPRRFGLMDLTNQQEFDQHKLIRHLGIEPLSADFTAAALKECLEGKQTSIKVALMDATLVVGVGNIYASEALFRAHIKPTRKAASITSAECAKLVAAVRQVLEAAIESGGSTLRDYVRSSGDAGYFQHHFQVYGREDEPCFICGKGIKKVKQAGRSTFYCATCQK